MGPSGDRIGKLQTEKTTGSEVSCTDIPLVIEDESIQSDAEVMLDCENRMTRDARSEQSVEGPDPPDLLPESPRSQTRRPGNIYDDTNTDKGLTEIQEIQEEGKQPFF